MDVNEITPMEPEDEVRGRDDYKQYVEWAKQGIQPPPITVVRGIEDGNWLSIDRRRLMAAKESGQKTILAWVSDTDMETAMPTPTHKSAVEQALKEGKPVPPEVLADYPDLTPKEAAPAKTEKLPAEKKEAKAPAKSKTLSSYGLKISKTKTARGNPVWEVTGNTFDHKDALKAAGGRYYGKSIWSFYGDEDPTSRILDTLSGKKEVAADEADVKRKRDAGPPESFTGLDRRLSVKPAKEGAYKQFIVARGGIPGDSEGGPGNDPALSEILRPHQIDGVNLAVSAIDKYGGFVLADGTGAGKTMQILATMNHYAKQGHTALIVVPNRTIINDAYKRDGKMLGLDFNVVKGSSLEKGKLNITTYASLNKIHASNPEYIAFDEAHSLKNVSSNRSQIGRRLASRAKGVLFASATPFDKGEHLPYLEKTGIFSRKSHDEIMVGLGYKKDTMTVRTKYGDKQITVWKPNVSILERARRMDALFEEISDLGLMVKREVSMDRVAVGYWGIKLPKDAHAKLADVEDFYLSKYEVGDADHLPPMAKAQMLMAQRRFQEHYKKEDAYKLAMSEVNAGRQVVIFATRVSPSHLKEQTYMELGGERILVDEVIVDTSPPTLPDLAEMFEKAGVKCSKIYGSGNVDSEVKKFQDGKTQIALATPEKGGAGLSLDDTVGDAPRTMIVVTPLFSGVDNVQLPGRINRMSTKSPSRVVYMIADTAIDEWNKGIITEKMKTLNAVVRGDISKLDLDDMDRDVGAEALPEPEKETFKQERLKDRQMEVVSRRGHSRPYGPQWEVQVTTFRDVETGKEYLWWSDRALSDFVPELKAGDKVTLTATTRQGYGGNDINLTHVKVDRTGPVPNKPADHHIRPMSKREGARIENH
ncbi:MAG: DEAD/DEAH box helicase family protein, partial [Christensenellaceae bacterium]|nr:DEAD/DEAH box helicase family protein [Christensenellaceae bacterium]